MLELLESGIWGDRTWCWEGATGPGTLGKTFDDLGASSDSVCSLEYSGRVVVMEAALVVKAIDLGRRKKSNLLLVGVANDPTWLDIFWR